jgi:hypothetical protein
MAESLEKRIADLERLYSANMSAASNTVMRFLAAFHPLSFYPRRHEPGQKRGEALVSYGRA